MHEYQNYLNYHDGIISRFDEKEFLTKSRTYNRLYRKFLPKSKESRILDIGCGVGLFLYYLKHCGYKNYYGIDISKENIDFVRKNVTNKCESQDMFVYLQNKEHCFDVIVLNEVLEHLVNERAIELLRLIFESLKTHGVLLVLVPNMENPITVYTRWHDFTHKSGFTQNSIKMALRLGKFNHIDIYPTIKFSRFAYIRKIILGIPCLLIRTFAVIFFQYPFNGRLFSKRIIAVAKK